MRSHLPLYPATSAAAVTVAVAVAVACLCLLRPAYGSVVADRSKTRELFAFVLANDDKWAPVLKQKVRVANVVSSLLPPLPVYEETAAAVTPLAVLRKALDEYSAFGSLVTYGSYVLRTAFGCFAYGHVALLMDLVAAVDDECRRAAGDDQAPPSGDTCPGETVTQDAMSLIMAVMDNVAAVNGFLGLLADAYDRHAKPGRAVDAQSLRDALRPVRDGVERALHEDCVIVAADHLDVDQACARLGLDSQAVRQHARSVGNSERESTESLLATIMDLLLKVYESLYVDTFYADVWRQILDVPNHVKIQGMGSGRKISYINAHE